ncbi:GNAT family N-acetyltransferase [Actinophytocola sp.]|uniref:GNAT family N-acetyltransferase n=1 Tax=Actinophytocola sp. TaxID=1872138 RepID=UPI00389AE3C4
MDRTIIAARDGVALADLTEADRQWLAERDDHTYDIDPDDRPAPEQGFEVFRAGVLDTASGQLIGQVNWHAVGYGPTAGCTAWNVGIGLLPGQRRRGAGSTALRLLVEHLFATTVIDRVEASADVANLPSQRALGKAGFRREGVLRGAQLRGGERRDMVAFGILRADLSPAERTIVAGKDGVALASVIPSDWQEFRRRGDHTYDPDRDDRPGPSFDPPAVLAVVDSATGELLGNVSWHAVRYGPTAGCLAWHVDVALFPEARDRGADVARLLVDHLFATTDVDRIEASGDLADLPTQRLLGKAGFRREGVLRGAQLRGGERRNMVSYSILRADLPPAVRTIIAGRDGVALASIAPEDRELLAERGDNAFGADPDERPVLHSGFEVHRVAVVDTETRALLGQMSWHAVGYGPTAACTAWNFGIMLLPESRGRGLGPTVIRLLVEHLFATTEVDRVEASTDHDNLPAQRALAKAGLTREGVVRGAQLRGGQRRDMIAYSILRTDLPDPEQEREIVASGQGVQLGDLLPGERDLLRGQDDDAFEVDPDDRPPRHHPQPHRLAVLDQHNGELLGAVSWHAVGYGSTAACEAWNIGIGLLPQSRGRGVGSIATRLLAEYLFATTDIDRVEAGTDRENVPAQRALAKAGFRPEGVIRGAQLRGGRRRDMLAYSLLRSDVVEATAPGVREVVVVRDGIALAEPAPGDREKFYIAGAGDFAVDPDDRPRVTGPTRSFLLSVVDAKTNQLLGGVSWHAVDYGGTVSSSAWNIGIGLLPGARGRGVGTAAQRMLVDHLFTTTELDRIEASTDVDNVAEQRALENAGFRREGVLRGAQLRGGVRRDLVHYGLVRGDLSN